MSPATVPELDSGGFGGDWYARDLPYGYDTLVENLVGKRVEACASLSHKGFPLHVYGFTIFGRLRLNSADSAMYGSSKSGTHSER